MARQAVLELIADASKLKSTLNDAEGHTDKFSGSMGKLGGVIAGALTGAAVLKFGSDSVKAFTESEQAQSKLELALKNSSATVGVHADDFAKLNSELAKHTLADDDVIAATEAQMVTFGASKQQIESMIPTVLDFAAKMGVEAPEAADLFDKASLGSVKALKTLGIEGFKPSGDKAKDLASIQDLLRDKVKGAAQAQLDAAGPGATMKKSMDELQEMVGKYLVPALSKLAEIGVAVMDFFAAHPAATALAAAIGALAAVIWIVNTATAAWAVITGGMSTAFWALNAAMAANPIGLVVIAIAALVAVIVIAYKNSETFRDIVNGAFNAVKNVVMGVFNWVKDNWPLLLAILTGPIGLAVLAITTHWDTIKNAVMGVFNWVRDNWPLLLAIITGPIGLAVLAITTHWDTIKNTFTGVKDWIGQRISNIVGFFSGLPGRIAAAAGDFLRTIRDQAENAKEWIFGKVNQIVGFFLSIPGRIANVGRDILSKLIPDLPGAGIISKAIGAIPGFAEGGIVPGPFGAPMLAMVHGGETIIPGGGGTAGSTSIVTLNVNVTAIDPAAASEAVITAIKEYERRNGTDWRVA